MTVFVACVGGAGDSPARQSAADTLKPLDHRAKPHTDADISLLIFIAIRATFKTHTTSL